RKRRERRQVMETLFPLLSPVRFVGIALLAGVIAGCSSAPPSPSAIPPDAPAEAPAKARPATTPAGLNLRGYPVAFREGYAAGCESGRDGDKRRDEARYKA